MNDCCEEFQAAQVQGTDGEEYGAAVGRGYLQSPHLFFVGSSAKLFPIRYCPWCGKKLAQKESE